MSFVLGYSSNHLGHNESMWMVDFEGFVPPVAESRQMNATNNTDNGSRLSGGMFAWAVPLILAVMLLASGCANVDTRPAPDGPTAPGAQTEPSLLEQAREASKAPRPGFTQDVLYKLLLAELAGRRSQLSLAVSTYLQVARQTRDPAVAERATRIAVFARDNERGQQAAQLWTEVAPDNSEAKQVYAAMLIRTGELDLAVAELEKLLGSGETGSEAGFSLVTEMLSRQKDRAKAMEVMERLVSKRADDKTALFAFAHLAARAGDMKRAEELLKQIIAVTPGDSRATILYARVLQREGDAEGALKVLADSLEVQPKASDVRMTYARLLVDAKRYEEARAQFERLAKDEPKNANVLYALGLLLLQTNRLDEAKAQFQQLVDIGQRVRTARFYLGRIAESQKDTAAALAAYRKVDRGEHYLNAHIRVAVIMAENGEVEDARQHLHGVVRRNMQEAIRLFRAEAELLTSVKRYDEAMGVYDLALDEQPGNADLLYSRAMLAERMDRLDILERDLMAVLARNPKNSDALNALGYTLADRTERYQEALDLINRAIEIKPNDHFILDSMGWVLYRLGRYAESVEYLRRAFKLRDDAEIAAHLGEVLWVMGNQDAAREVWDTALKNKPKDEHLLDAIQRFKP